MIIAQTPASPAELWTANLNLRLKQASEAVHFTIASAIKPCPSGVGQPRPVDLVALMDMSGSMADEAQALSDKLTALINAVTAGCTADVRVVCLGIAGVRLRTRFTQTCRKYLIEGLKVPRRELESEAKDTEDGARSLIDLARHFDWRPDTTRLLLFLGDEGLYRGDPQNREDELQASRAIATAQERGVKVFTYLGTPVRKQPNPKTVSEYQRLATATGGQAYLYPVENLARFEAALAELTCAGPAACTIVELPELQPCFEIRWGEQPEDRLETSEVEILYLRARNPYANLIFKDLMVSVAIKAVSPGEDTTASVALIPSDLICFGDLQPCDPQQPEQPACLARELILLTQAAPGGSYSIDLNYTCTIEIGRRGRDTLNLQLVTPAAS